MLTWLSSVAPSVYDAARQSTVVWVWRNVAVTAGVFLVSTLVGVYCLSVARRFDDAESSGDRHSDWSDRQRDEGKSENWSIAALFAFVLTGATLVLLVTAASDLARIDYLTLREVINLIPVGK